MIRVEQFMKPGPCTKCRLQTSPRNKISVPPMRPFYLCEICSRQLFDRLAFHVKGDDS